MNLFDIIVFAILISSTLMGLQKGLLKLTIGIVCFVLSLLVTWLLFPMVQNVATEHIHNAIMLNIVSSIGAYLISMLFFAFVQSQVINLVGGLSGGMIDRLFGLVIGAGRGLFICLIIFGLIAVATSSSYVGAKTAFDLVDKIDHKHYPKWLSSARSYWFLEHSGKLLKNLFPEKTLHTITLPKVPHELPEAQTEIIMEQLQHHEDIAPKTNALVPSISTNHKAEHPATSEQDEGSLESEIKALLER